jgi:hypothetical protein
VVSFTPLPLFPPRRRPWYPLGRRLDEPQSRSERGGEEKNSQPVLRLAPPIIQHVAQLCTTELSRILLPVCMFIFYVADYFPVKLVSVKL